MEGIAGIQYRGNEWRTDTSLRGHDERGQDAGVPEPLWQDRSTGNEESRQAQYEMMLLPGN